jgi:hypothetical protein
LDIINLSATLLLLRKMCRVACFSGRDIINSRRQVAASTVMVGGLFLAKQTVVIIRIEITVKSVGALDGPGQNPPATLSYLSHPCVDFFDVI